MAVTEQPYGTYGAQTKRAYYYARYQQLKSLRSSFDSHVQEISDWISPRRTRFSAWDRNRGERKNQKIIDSGARLAHRTMAAGLHAGLSSPARPWFRLTTADPALRQHRQAKMWLHATTSVLEALCIQTNTYNAFPVIYGDTGLFGTGAMAVLEDGEDVFRCYAYPFGSYVLGTSARGIVNEFMREYVLTVGQVVEQFGGPDGTPAIPGRMIDWRRMSQATKHAWDKGQYDSPVTILWAVVPNREYQPGRRETRFLPIKSCYFELASGRSTYSQQRDGDIALQESGFHEFPIMAPRWDITGEDDYGTDCPAMIALGDTKQLQVQQREKGKAIQKQVNPPMVGPPQLRSQAISLLPGSIAYLEETAGSKLRNVHEVVIDLAALREDMAETRQRIRQAFYADLFLMLQEVDQFSTGQKTAEEIRERVQEKMVVLGPTLERFSDEFHDPFMERIYAIAYRRKMIPEVPEVLDGSDTPFEYTSILAQAMKLQGVNAQDRMLNTAMGVAEVWPEVRHKINIFKVFDNYGDMLGADPETLRSTEDAEAVTDQEAMAARMAQMAETAKAAGQGAQAASQAPLTGDTALSSLIGAGAPA